MHDSLAAKMWPNFGYLFVPGASTSHDTSSANAWLHSFFPSDSPISWLIHLCVFNNGGGQALGVLDIDGLDVAIKLLLGTLLIVTLTGDTNTESEWYTFDAGFPDLLVELRVNADVLGALYICS